MVERSDKAEARQAWRDRLLARAVPVLVAILAIGQVTTGLALAAARGDLADARSEVSRLSADSGARATKASEERAAFARQLADQQGQIAQYVSDNEILRHQLEQRGLKPAVPVRAVSTTTGPKTPTTTTRPSGSGPPPAPPTTNCMVNPICVGASCTPCVP